MSGGAALTILLPDGTDAAWAPIVRTRLGPAVDAMAEALGLAAPSLAITPMGSEPVLIGGAARHVLQSAATPGDVAGSALGALYRHHWEMLLAPALAERGIGATPWLRHAARRGLTVDELAALAREGATEEGVAWRLADAHRPAITLMAGRSAIVPLSDEGVRRAAAMEVAAASGLPFPIPAEPVADPLVGDYAVVVMIGALRGPALPPQDLGHALVPLAPAVIDPALAVALLTDEACIPARLGTLALASPGPVGIAEALLRALEAAPWPLDPVAVVEAAAGLTLPQ